MPRGSRRSATIDDSCSINRHTSDLESGSFEEGLALEYRGDVKTKGLRPPERKRMLGGRISVAERKETDDGKWREVHVG